MISVASKKVKGELRALVLAAVAEFVADQDFRMELSGASKKRLRAARVSRGKTISFSKIQERYL